MSPHNDDNQQWWYCLRHQASERGAGCAATDRLGPYASQEQADQALETAAQRSQSWDEDPQWNDEAEQDK